MAKQEHVYELNLTKRPRPPMRVTMQMDCQDIVLDVTEPRKALNDEMDEFLISMKTEDETEREREISDRLWTLVAHILSNNEQGVEVTEQFAKEELSANQCWDIYTLYCGFVANILAKIDQKK